MDCPVAVTPMMNRNTPNTSASNAGERLGFAVSVAGPSLVAPSVGYRMARIPCVGIDSPVVRCLGAPAERAHAACGGGSRGFQDCAPLRIAPGAGGDPDRAAVRPEGSASVARVVVVLLELAQDVRVIDHMPRLAAISTRARENRELDTCEADLAGRSVEPPGVGPRWVPAHVTFATTRSLFGHEIVDLEPDAPGKASRRSRAGLSCGLRAANRAVRPGSPR